MRMPAAFEHDADRYLLVDDTDEDMSQILTVIAERSERDRCRHGDDQ